ncbi:MAG: OprO/OprP family phosphate-selective porin [Candidatus Aminicenantes bacterium]|nr:OprO/OprP family phosphate-selective porin [Candidatus Aminicenantes bacterium]
MMIRLSRLILVVFVFSTAMFAAEGNEVTTKKSNLTLGGQLQTQYQYVNSNPTTNRLILRRGRLIISSKLSKNIGLKIQMEAGMQKFTFQDAYLTFSLKPADIFVGQKHVPFSREALNSSTVLQMIERSYTSEFAPFRQVGIGLQGFLWNKKIEYMAGFYNGSVDAASTADFAANKLSKVKIYTVDGAASNDNNRFLYAGRLDFHPLGYMEKQQSYLQKLEHPLLSFGINFFTSDDSPKKGHTSGLGEIKRTSAYGADMALKCKGFAGTLEYIRRDLSWWNTADLINESPQYTFTIQGGFMIVPQKFEIAARYEFVDFDENNLLRGPLGQDRDKWTTFGLNYFIEGHNMKIQFNYILKQEDMPAGAAEADNNTALVQFAYFF